MKRYTSIFFIFLFYNAIAQQNNLNLIVGTYTYNSESKGVYVYNFNSESGELKLKSSSGKIVNPSFLSISSDKKTVYTVSENGDESKIFAFSFN